MLRLPSVVFEIVAGILIGPFVFDWVEVDQTIEVRALIGLAYLLFLAGRDRLQPAARPVAAAGPAGLGDLVRAGRIGMELGAVDSAEASALIAAGLLSVLIFPLAGLVMLRRSMEGSRPHQEPSGLHSSRYAPATSPE
jgi:predicted Kef-type K+ transport protein